MNRCFMRIIFSGAFAARNSYTESSWPVYIYELNCTGDERAIWNCSHTILGSCNHRDDASVRCQSIVYMKLIG